LKCDLPGAAEVQLGAGSIVDPGVLLGYPSGRPGVSGDARVIGPVDKVECPFGIVIPYENGIDVRRRPEWNTVAVLPRPVVRPPKRRR